MLQELHIENIAVIERADIDFAAGLNILTGETGAGKSIVIDAIGAVLGDRVSRELVRRGADKAVVTAVFDPDPALDWLRDNGIDAEEELILQRRISGEGKSGCRVCGVPVTASQLKELGALLVDVHGQNDGRLLMDERLHRGYLDRFGRLQPELDAYRVQFEAYNAIRREMGRLSMDEVEKERLSESLRYQIAELERAELKIGEKDALVSRRDLLRNAEKLTEAVDQAFAALYGGEENAVSLTQNAEYYASRASAIAPELDGRAWIFRLRSTMRWKAASPCSTSSSGSMPAVSTSCRLTSTSAVKSWATSNTPMSGWKSCSGNWRRRKSAALPRRRHLERRGSTPRRSCKSASRRSCGS